MNKIILILLVFLIRTETFSQKVPADYYFTGLQAHYGFIIPHTAAIEPVSHTKPYGIELNFSKLHTSYESWSVFHNFNISGIQLAYYNFQNPGIVGSAFALSIFTEPILVRTKRLLFSVKAGAGFSYQTEIYNIQTDSMNKFFSTHISFPLYLSARLKYRISSKTFLTFSGTYNHISNGAIKIPNFGINFPTLSIGLEYYQKPFPELDFGYTAERHRKVSDKYLLCQMSMGSKVVWGEPISVFVFGASYTRKFRTFYSLNGGAELLFDGGAKRLIEVQEKTMDYKRIALLAGQDFILGKIIFSQHLGTYMYSPFKPPHPVFQKYELSYRISDFLLGINLRAYTSDADLFAFALTYMFHL